MSDVSEKINDLINDVIEAERQYAPTLVQYQRRQTLRDAIAATEAERDAAVARVADLESRANRMYETISRAAADERLDSFRFGGYIADWIEPGDLALIEPATRVGGDV